MKKMIFIYLILVCITSIAQTIQSPEAAAVEIFLGSTAFDGGTTKFKMTAVSQVWAGKLLNGTGYNNVTTWLSSDYNILNHTAINNQDYNGWSGWDFILSQTHGVDVYGYGKYKLSVGSDYFYLDYRDDRCAYYDVLGNPTGHNIDIWVKYNQDNNKFSINSYGGISTNPYWTEISNGSTINFWTLKGMGSPSTGKFEPFAPENLSVTTVSGKPKLTWQHHSPAEDYWVGYEVYRCITSVYPPASFTKIADVSKYTLTYTDNNLSLGNQQIAYYRIKTKNSSALSIFSNQVQFGTATPPSAPQNLQLTVNSNHNPVLTWNYNTEFDMAEYVIYIRENGGSWWETGRVDKQYRIFTDIHTTTTMPFDLLEYHVKAKNTNNLYSGMSNLVSVNGTTAKYAESNGLTEEIKLADEKEIPTAYSLAQNYPNPFNPATTISYQLPSSGNVTLKIYNSLGAEVSELVNGYGDAGSYTAAFNAVNLPSGIYFYKIQSGSFNEVRKMLLLK